MNVISDKTDPRVARSRAAALEAATAVFFEKGYDGTTMDEIAERARITKRTLYNNYPDKEALFRLVVAEVLETAGAFTRDLHAELTADIARHDLERALASLADRLVQRILRPEVIAVRRLLIGESRRFPDLASEYFQRAPARVVNAIAREFADLQRRRKLRSGDATRAAAQFAYLVVGESLDRAVMTGAVPKQAKVRATVSDGITTFLARYGTKK